MIYQMGSVPDGDKLETVQSDGEIIYRLSNSGGEGMIRQYSVYDGVDVMFNDMHLTRFKEGGYGENFLMIEHCREGRFEAKFKDGRLMYMGAGDVCVHNVDYAEIVSSSMPIRHYHGITVIIRPDRDKVFENMLAFVGADLDGLAERVRNMGGIALIRLNERTEHIFDELYRLTDDNRMGYLRLKVPELLLFLNGANLKEERIKERCLSKETSDILKSAELYIWQNIGGSLTIRVLAARCGMSETSFKNNFKVLYGCPIHEYINTVRMQIAAYKLVRTEEKISAIARSVGFKTENKFAARFAAFYGKTPREYRKNAVLSDWTVNSPVWRY